MYTVFFLISEDINNNFWSFFFPGALSLFSPSSGCFFLPQMSDDLFIFTKKSREKLLKALSMFEKGLSTDGLHSGRNLWEASAVSICRSLLESVSLEEYLLPWWYEGMESLYKFGCQCEESSGGRKGPSVHCVGFHLIPLLTISHFCPQLYLRPPRPESFWFKLSSGLNFQSSQDGER